MHNELQEEMSDRESTSYYAYYHGINLLCCVFVVVFL